MMFLYILNMEKAKMIKIGIASSNNRIKQHLNTYTGLIDLNKSYIVTAKDDNTIRMLEKQLLNDYIEYKIVNNRYQLLDGYSELRSIDILDNIIADIKYKAKNLNHKQIKIIKGIKLEKHTTQLRNLRGGFVYTPITKDLVMRCVRYIIQNNDKINNVNKETNIGHIALFNNYGNELLEICSSDNLFTYKDIFVLKYLMIYKPINIKNANKSHGYNYCINVNDFCQFINIKTHNHFTTEEIIDVFFNIGSNNIKSKFCNMRIIERCKLKYYTNQIAYIQCLFNIEVMNFIMQNDILALI